MIATGYRARMLTARSAVIAVLSLAVLLGGCGDEGGDAASRRLDIGAVVRAAERDGTAQATATIEAEGMGLQQPLRLTGEGAMSLTALEADLTFDGAPILQRMGVPADGPIRLVMLRERAYVDVPEPLRAEIPEGRRWIGVDLGEAMGAGEAEVRAILRMDVAGSLAPFAAGAPLQSAGEEEIDGVQTTRWRGEMSVDDYLDTLPAAERKEVRAALLQGPTAMKEADLAERHPVEMWIDGDDRVRRAESTTKLAATPDMPAGTVRMRFDLGAFGEPAAITAPAAGSVWDATKAWSGAMQQAG